MKNQKDAHVDPAAVVSSRAGTLPYKEEFWIELYDRYLRIQTEPYSN